MVNKSLIPVYDILTPKKAGRKEAHVILFEYCNLQCSFCHQDHDSTVGMDNMMGKIETLLSNTDKTDPYIINLTGGELFLDEFPDELFEEYFNIGKRLLTHYDDAVLVLGANLVYEKIDRLKLLVNRLRVYGVVKVATSYDPSGRFTKKSFELFMENVGKMHGYVETVNVVITKQNIESILAGKENATLGWLSSQFSVYFDHYIPSEQYELIQPTEDLIGELYLYLNKHHPQSHPIVAWKQNSFNSTTCRSTKIINKDGVVTTCWSEAGKDVILDEGLGLAAKADAEQRFLDHYDCLACEYYQRCGLRCFLHHSFVESDAQTCSIKKMFDVIIP